MRRLLPLLALFMASPAPAEWWEAKTDNFIVYSESKKEDAEQFARLLERYDNALRYLQGRPVPGYQQEEDVPPGSRRNSNASPRVATAAVRTAKPSTSLAWVIATSRTVSIPTILPTSRRLFRGRGRGQGRRRRLGQVQQLQHARCEGRGHRLHRNSSRTIPRVSFRIEIHARSTRRNTRFELCPADATRMAWIANP